MTINLRTIAVNELHNIIEELYYRTCIQDAHLHQRNSDKTVKVVIDEVTAIELKCAAIERYDLAILCRDTNQQLACSNDLQLNRMP